MTLTEAFVFKAGNGISATDAETVLEFAGLDPDADWDPLDDVLRCQFYDALLGYLSQDNIGVKSISEGGYSISYDGELKAKALYSLALESKCGSLIARFNPEPTVTNKSNMW